jgi:hypothetical protein
MKVNPESYLGANRDNPDELVQAVLGDLSVVGALREKSDTEIHASDTIYTILGQLDVQLGTAVAFWQENEPVPGAHKFERSF